MQSGARAHNDKFHTRVSSFIGQHFGKKIGLLPTAGAENHGIRRFSHPTQLMPSKFEKTRPSRKGPEPIAK